jgi:hypothetical protein
MTRTTEFADRFLLTDQVAIITGVTEPVLRKKAPESAARAAHIAREIAERFGAIRGHLISEAIDEIER